MKNSVQKLEKDLVEKEYKKRTFQKQKTKDILRLHIAGTKPTRIAKLLSVPLKQVKETLQIYRNLIDFDLLSEVETYRIQKSDILDSVEFKLLSKTLEKCDKASLSQISSTLGVVSNMNRLEKGQSTSNQAVTIEQYLKTFTPENEPI